MKLNCTSVQPQSQSNLSLDNAGRQKAVINLSYRQALHCLRAIFTYLVGLNGIDDICNITLEKITSRKLNTKYKVTISKRKGVNGNTL